MVLFCSDCSSICWLQSFAAQIGNELFRDFINHFPCKLQTRAITIDTFEGSGSPAPSQIKLAISAKAKSPSANKMCFA